MDQRFSVQWAISLFILPQVYLLLPTCDVKKCLYSTSVVYKTTRELSEFKNITVSLEYPFSSSAPQECYINSSELVDSIYNDVNINMTCIDHIVVHFIGIENHTHVLVNFKMYNCQITYESLNRFQKAITLKSLYLKDMYMTSKNDTCFNDNASYICDISSTIEMIDLVNVNFSYSNNYKISDLLHCLQTHNELQRGTVYNTSLNEEVKYFVPKFPKIQTLILKNITEITYINYTWHAKYRMAKSLTDINAASPIYVKDFKIEIPGTRNRNMLSLENCGTLDLSNIFIAGILDIIKMSKNNIKNLPKTLFQSIMQVKYINLDNNGIKVLQETLFDGLKSLKYLSLKKNNITSLPETLFRDLENVQFLDLSFNKITNLRRNLFSFMHSLQEIHLENNLLVSIPSDAFLLTQTSINAIILDNNPLLKIPEILFYFRNLQSAFLRNTSITLHNLTEFTLGIDLGFFLDSISPSTNGVVRSVFSTPESFRLIDLSGSNITSINLGKNLEPNKHSDTILALILKNFNIKLYKNNILCDCSVNLFHEWVQNQIITKGFNGKEIFLKEWICMEPREFKYWPVVNVSPKDTYCERNVSNCPSNCVCYIRSFTHIVIVDCEAIGISMLPKIMPSGILDLWFSNNNISIISSKSYFPRIRQLKLDHNSIHDIKADAFLKLKKIELFYLHSNLLTYIPKEIQTINLTTVNSISFERNPLKCDCHSLWMKKWVFSIQKHIKNITAISCNLAYEEGHQFIHVKDEEFICVENYDTLHYVIVPSVLSSIFLMFILICISLVFFYRLEVKVLIFIYTGLHPFDRNLNECEEDIDLLVIHEKSSEEWVYENIAKYLEDHENSFSVCCLSRDFIAGYSYQDSIASLTKQSKRMIVVLSEDLIDKDHLFKISWKEAKVKIEEFQTNFLVAIGHNVLFKNIHNKDFKKYIRRSGFLQANDSLIKEKMLYFLHNKKYKRDLKTKKNVNITSYIQNINFNKVPSSQFDVFITYCHQAQSFALNTVRKTLEMKSHSVLLPDRDFVPGHSKEENILRAISLSKHTVFIYFGNKILDEWSLFTFRSALQKSVGQKWNHLIVIWKQKCCSIEQVVDSDLKRYMESHVIMYAEEMLFLEKLTKILNAH